MRMQSKRTRKSDLGGKGCYVRSSETFFGLRITFCNRLLRRFIFRNSRRPLHITCDALCCLQRVWFMPDSVLNPVYSFSPGFVDTVRAKCLTDERCCLESYPDVRRTRQRNANVSLVDSLTHVQFAWGNASNYTALIASVAGVIGHLKLSSQLRHISTTGKTC